MHHLPIKLTLSTLNALNTISYFTTPLALLATYAMFSGIANGASFDKLPWRIFWD
jgi:hypothetical protein